MSKFETSNLELILGDINFWARGEKYEAIIKKLTGELRSLVRSVCLHPEFVDDNGAAMCAACNGHFAAPNKKEKME